MRVYAGEVSASGIACVYMSRGFVKFIYFIGGDNFEKKDNSVAAFYIDVAHKFPIGLHQK